MEGAVSAGRELFLAGGGVRLARAWLRGDRVGLFVLALIVRVAVCLWANGRIPPSADGKYYDIIARRIAGGDGYTWLWPDGTVTFAAHYPVGYPAIIGGLYAVFGASPLVAMLFAAVMGSLAAVAVHAMLASRTTRGRALVGGALLALHPAVVPYTPAIMTEGVTLALWSVSLALFLHAYQTERVRFALAAALVLGVATLVRPQSLILAPLFGFVFVPNPGRPGAMHGHLRRLGFAVLALVLAVAVCAPWTARNCSRMKSCALVSVNGGWNLLIGAQTDTGAWAPVEVPLPCRTVWDEAGKDACFGAEARREIARDPAAFARRVPAKLAATFDYFGAAPYYLHEANASVFPARAKLALGSVETAFSRITLLLGLFGAAAGFSSSRGRKWAAVACGLAVVCALTRHAWPGYLLLAGLLIARGGTRRPEFVGGGLLVLTTALMHAVFFGAGRYGLMVVPVVCLAAAYCPLPCDLLARVRRLLPSTPAR